jgi:hypothetical protein
VVVGITGAVVSNDVVVSAVAVGIVTAGVVATATTGVVATAATGVVVVAATTGDTAADDTIVTGVIGRGVAV